MHNPLAIEAITTGHLLSLRIVPCGDSTVLALQCGKLHLHNDTCKQDDEDVQEFEHLLNEEARGLAFLTEGEISTLR